MIQINIFISYRSKDAAIRDKIIQCLKPLELSYQEKYKVEVKTWYDDNEMIAGDNIQFKISDNLEKSHIVICIFTPRYFESDWCTFELKNSVNQTRPPSKKRLIPIVYEDVNWDTDLLSGIKAVPSKDAKPLINWQNQSEAFTLVAKEVDENIKIFADPKALDFRSKQRSIFNSLFQDKPDLKASVKNLMSLVDEHSPDYLVEAIQIHVIYNTYEDNEDQVKIENLAQTRCEIISRMFKILKKIEEKYAIG